MLPEQLNFDVNVISECLDEMSNPIIDKEKFLNESILNKLIYINNKYTEDFDIKLLEVENELKRPDLDLKTLSNQITKLSKLSNSIHSIALEVLDVI